MDCCLGRLFLKIITIYINTISNAEVRSEDTMLYPMYTFSFCLLLLFFLCQYKCRSFVPPCNSKTRGQIRQVNPTLDSISRPWRTKWNRCGILNPFKSKAPSSKLTSIDRSFDRDRSFDDNSRVHL